MTESEAYGITLRASVHRAYFRGAGSRPAPPTLSELQARVINEARERRQTGVLPFTATLAELEQFATLTLAIRSSGEA